MSSREIKTENWQEDYEKKLVPAEKAALAVKSGDNIYFPSAYTGYMPHALVERKDELRNVKVEISSPIFDPGWLSPGMEDSFELRVRTYLAAARVGHDEGRISFLPYTNGSYFVSHRDDREDTPDVDVFFMEVSPPDENGVMTYGPHAWQKRDFCSKAKIIVAEIDRNIIRTCGDTAVHVSEVDIIVDITGEPLDDDQIQSIVDRFPEDKQALAKKAIASGNPRTLRMFLGDIDEFDNERIEFLFRLNAPTDAVKEIARHLKSVMKDRDTIQIGVGSISGFMIELGAFDDCEDLGIWSEVSAPGLANLVKRGIATGKYSTLMPGKAVIASTSGMRGDEIKWLDNNPLFELHSARYVVNIANLSQIENMVAINNITQVDLTGQITCETQFGPRMINGPGGQPELHIGAFFSPGGRAISLLKSTWSDGAVSTIVPYLDHGSIVTIPRVFADMVITEYGVARLLGKTHRERTQELIRIAHPDHRAELEEAAKDIC